MQRKHGAALWVLAGVLGWARPADAYDTVSVNYAYEYAPTNHPQLSNCDECTAVLNLPWSFPFFGRTYNQVTVSSNGFLRMGSATIDAQWFNALMTWDGSTSAPGPVIAPFWDDWNPAVQGSVYYGRVGNAFIIEWYAMYHYTQTTGGSYTFEVKLFPDGRIEFHYGNVVGGWSQWDYGLSATVGIQEDVDTMAKPLSVNWPFTASNTAHGLARPGTAAVYVRPTDGFYTPPRTREYLLMRQNFQCQGFSATNQISTTYNPWSWMGMPFNGCTVSGNLEHLDADTSTKAMTDTLGYDVAVIPGMVDATINHGTYRFIRRTGFTPRQYRETFPVSYDGVTTHTSKLDYWDSGAYDKPVLMLTGFDPLNKSSTAEYLVLMADLARIALAEGRDIVIGKYGHGNGRLHWFHDEVGHWVDNAYVRGGRKVQLVGVSMGGVLARGALWWNNWNINAKVSYWYSVDAPQTGANMGRTDRGIANLLMCNKPSTDDDREEIESNPAADMVYRRPVTCSCESEPENSTCTSTSQFHNEYYNSISWPTTVPRAALVFGDGTASGGFSKLGSGSLYDFEYGGTCSEDRDWGGGQRDCNAGSRHITGEMVNTHKDDIPDYGFCDWFDLELTYEPAFISVDSAFGLKSPLNSNTGDNFCTSSHGTLTPTYWNGWAANGHNEYHKKMTPFLRDWMLGVIRWIEP